MWKICDLNVAKQISEIPLPSFRFAIATRINRVLCFDHRICCIEMIYLGNSAMVCSYTNYAITYLLTNKSQGSGCGHDIDYQGQRNSDSCVSRNVPDQSVHKVDRSYKNIECRDTLAPYASWSGIMTISFQQLQLLAKPSTKYHSCVS